MSISIAIAMNTIEEAFRSAFRSAMEKSGIEDAKMIAVMKAMENIIPKAKETMRESLQKAVADSKKEKAPKDPNAPKKARSAYQVFCQDVRNDVIPKKDAKKMEGIFGTKENVTQAIAIFKSEKIDMAEMGNLWKLVSEKGKNLYAERAEEDKTRYEEEMKDYVPKPVVKAPPKAPSSAFEMYYRENCTEEWKKENKEDYASAKERRDAFKKMWEDESKDTQDQYAERLKEEKAKYKQILSNFEESLSEDELKVFKAKTDKNAPKKARSAYILYSSDHRDEASKLLLKENPDQPVVQTDIMAKLGKMWSNASDKEKAKYAKLAEQDKARYESEMELYKNGEFSSGSDSESEKESRKGKKTGYMVFVARRKIELAKENDGMSKKEIQEMAVKEWKDLDEDDEETGKAYWKKVASGEIVLEELEDEAPKAEKKSKGKGKKESK